MTEAPPPIDPAPTSPLSHRAAPPAPGRMGMRLDSQAGLVYLEELGRWCDDRRRELEQLDQAALQSPDAHAVTSDVMLSMALWKAVADRYELLLVSWDSGRAGPAERERMSSLIWGRLDATLDPSLLAAPALQGSSLSNSGLAVSLPEACRLSDALAIQLRVRLKLDPSGLEINERLRQLRAQMERVRDQVDLEPAGTGQQQAAQRQSQLARRLKEASDKAARGGDVVGLLNPLEIEATTFERDLIVNGARRRQAGALVDQARTRRRELQARAAALQQLVDNCVRTVDPSPKYAVPEVDALGPVPNTAEALEVYLRRLDQVGRAMTLAQTAYSRSLADREDLLTLLDAYQVKAAALGLGEDPDLSRAYELARDALARQPTRMLIANQLVGLYQSYLQIAQPGPTGPGQPNPGRDVRKSR